MKLSIVVPAHNEEENIVNVIDKIEKGLNLDYELIIVNDHSTDRTEELVQGLFGKYPNLRLVENLNPGGFANAIKAGFSSMHTEVVVPVMGDLCDDLQTINLMYNKIEEGYDVICGSRYMGSGQRLGGSRLKSFLSCSAGKSLHYLSGLPTHDIANAFKMYRMEVIKAVDIKSEGFEISMEITLKAYYKGFKITEVPTVWRERTKGKSNFKIFKLLPGYLKLYI
ncbi:MAG: glycosyl transferase family 2, partial [Candidatus Omnitrophica bacterium CG11_big_fil_rev_8_21_14_0_20_43_6]